MVLKGKPFRKIKVLRIIARLNIGGPAIHTILLTEGLDKSRFDSVLITGRTEEREGDMIYLAKEKDVHPIVIPELRQSLNICDDIIAFWKLFCLIRREKPDIIHTHTAKAGALGRLAGLLYKLTRFLSIESFRKLLGIAFSNNGGLFPISELKLIHTFHGHVLHSYFGRIKSVFFIWIEKFLAKFTHRIIAISESVRKELIDLKITSPEKIVTIPLGLELEKYLNIRKNSPKNKAYRSVGIIGRLVPIKNHRMFLDAAKRLVYTSNIGQRIKFFVVGDGPLRHELENYAQRLGIKQDVIFTGWIKDLEKIYSELDIVALTSLNEGTPVALLEAQAASCPCVATKAGGINDVIEDGKNGFLVPSQDTVSFVEALIKLLNNPQLMKTIGTYGRTKVKDRFSKKRLVKNIEALYEQEMSG